MNDAYHIDLINNGDIADLHDDWDRALTPSGNNETDYQRYRGKCREFCEAAIAADPSLTLVRGYYICPFWGKQEHWWTVRQDGTIHDPTAAQFPSNGHGDYEPFDGTVECAECGKSMPEADASFHGNYAFCSCRCQCLFVGIDPSRCRESRKP